MGLLKTLAKETAIYGISSILMRVLTFAILTPYLTRIFLEEQQEFGLQSYLYAWTAFLMVLFTFRLETALFKFASNNSNKEAVFLHLFKITFGLSAFLTILIVLFSGSIATFIEYPDKQSFILMFAGILFFDTLSALPFALLRLQSKPYRFAIIKMVNLTLHIGLILYFYSLLPGSNVTMYFPEDWGIGFVFVANLTASIGTFLLLLPTVFSSLNSRSQQNVSTDFSSTVFQYSWPLVIASTAGIVNELIDRLMLKELLEGGLDERMSQVGIYSACYKIAILINLFTQAFNYAAEPFFFRNESKENARALYAKVTLLYTLVACIAMGGICMNLNIFQYFIGSSYREGLVIVPVLLVANLFLGLYYNVAIWYKLSGQTKYGASIGVFGAGITILANIALIPLFIQWGRYGYEGSAWATLICYASMLIAAAYFGRKQYPIPYAFSKIFLMLLVTVTYSAVFLYMQSGFDYSVIRGVFASFGLILILFLMNRDTLRTISK